MTRSSVKNIKPIQMAQVRFAYLAYCRDKELSPAADSSVAAFKKSRRNQWTFTLDELRAGVRDNSNVLARVEN